jgi:hypothetical protein
MIVIPGRRHWVGAKRRPGRRTRNPEVMTGFWIPGLREERVPE